MIDCSKEDELQGEIDKVTALKEQAGDGNPDAACVMGLKEWGN